MSNSLNTKPVIQASGINFGTSGARGLVKQFTAEVVAAFTTAFVSVMQRDYRFERVAVAIDLRPSSPDIAASCCSAIRQAGFEVDYYGVLPTPALAYQAINDGIPAVMITGSHIPYDRNGIKFYRPDGEITKQDELAIIEHNSAFELSESQPLPTAASRASESFTARYTDFFKPDALKGLTIGFYQHSSAARDLFTPIFETLGAEVVALARTDQFVPIDTEAVSEQDRQRAKAWIQEHRFDALISTDGDADRPLIGDETGNWLRGDLVGLLTAQQLSIEALAVPVSCNTAIELSESVSKVVRTRIGSPYVIEGMQSLQSSCRSVAGFEANGGFLLGSDITNSKGTLTRLPTRDALLPVIAVLAGANAKGLSLSQLTASLPKRVTMSDRLTEFPTAKSRALIAEWSQNSSQLVEQLGLGKQPPKAVNTIDGLRIELSGGDTVHIRPSGNAPELRCYCESDSEPHVESLLMRTMTFLNNCR